MPTKPATVHPYKPTELQAQRTVYGVTFAADGSHVFGGEDGGTIQKWRIKNGREVPPNMAANGHVYGVVASPDGQWIVTGDWGRKVIVWEAAPPHRKVLEISEHSGDVNTVDVSSDSTRIASGSDDRTVRIFGITDGSPLIAPLYHDNRVYGVKFSPAGDRLATATYDVASVRVYDTHSGDKLFDIPVEVNGCPVTPLAWSFDGQKLFATSPGAITCLNLSTLSRSQWSMHNHDSKSSIITNGKFIACSAGSSVSLWDIFSQKQIGPLLEHAGTVLCISLSPDERHLACGHDNKITIHDLGGVLPMGYFQGYPLSQPPLMHMTELVLKSWSQGDLMKAETVLSEEIERSVIPTYRAHALANRALIRTRLRQWDSALDDANKSLQINPSPITYIAMALCHIGQGNHELALQEFDIVFHGCDPHDSVYLLLVKAILSFVSGKYDDAVSRLHRLITASDQGATYDLHHVLANMHLKRAEYESAVQIFERTRSFSPSNEPSPLVTISLIFGWTFDELKFTAYQRLCETLYASGHVKEMGETLSRMVNSLAKEEKEATHGRILEAIVTRSGEISTLAWTGRSSSKHTCLPSSPTAYTQMSYPPPSIPGDELEKRTSELRNLFSPLEAGTIFGRVTRLQPVRFVHFRLHLPCIVFPVRSLRKDEENVYSAKVAGLGDLKMTTGDSLPLKEPRNLVVVHPWIRDLEAQMSGTTYEDEIVSDVESNEDSITKADSDTELVRVSIVEEVSQPEVPSDEYTRALQLIARLRQPFTGLLLLKQPDGAFKRVAADHEIVVSGLGSNVSKDIRAEVLEIL